MSSRIQIGNKGIKQLLDNTSSTKAITEYIWNGIDAEADQIDVTIDYHAGGALKKLSIEDNGKGIAHDKLKEKFTPFYESEKVTTDKRTINHSIPHGKRGVGRLTFYKFAYRVKWTTTYSRNEELYRYSIHMDSDNLKEYNFKPKKLEKNDGSVGTIVEFYGFLRFMHVKEEIDKIHNGLKVEFAWFMKLNPHISITVNKEKLDASDLEEKSEETVWRIDGFSFKIKYVQWKELSENEYSRYYYLKEDGSELFKEHTGLNKQKDGFFHSVYISSAYFETFNFKSIDTGQKSLSGRARSDETFKKLQKRLNQFLLRKRKPFLKGKSEQLVAEYVKERIIPDQPKDEFEKLKTDELKHTVKEIYKAEPQIFKKLNEEQKKTFVGLLTLVLDSDEREKIFDIILQVTELTPKERTELQKILKDTHLSSITKAINFVHKRLTQIELLRQIVYNDELDAKEVAHLQEIVENNLWIFGEEYTLYGNSETNFKKILEKIRKEIFNDDSMIKLEHPESNRQVDVFAIKQQIGSLCKDLLIIELKRPKVKLGYDEVTQIKCYRDTLESHPELNAKNLNWKIILVGKTLKSNAVENERKNLKSQGKLGLIAHSDNIELFILTWGEIINEFEIRHNSFLEKLNIKKDNLVEQSKTADEAVEKSIGLNKYTK